MAVRQYIGARYVTKVYENSLDPSSAEWEAGINYEPLTMVTYNMGSYLSKKAVPASVGDPATNPTYWTQTGFYNGQIAYLDANKQNKDLDTPVSISGITYSTVETTLQGLNDNKANKSDLTSNMQTISGGASANIPSGSYFYLDGVLYKAKVAILSGQGFTNQNCEEVTDGGLNDLRVNVSVSVTTDGVKTNEQLLNELFAKVEYSRLSEKSMFSTGYYRFYPETIRSTEYTFSHALVNASNIEMESVTLKSTGSTYRKGVIHTSDMTPSDKTSDVPSSGMTYKITY